METLVRQMIADSTVREGGRNIAIIPAWKWLLAS
jgi:hypothetical protein